MVMEPGLGQDPGVQVSRVPVTLNKTVISVLGKMKVGLYSFPDSKRFCSFMSQSSLN